MQYNKNYLFLHKYLPQDKIRKVVLEGGTRSGKTYSVLLYVVNFCIRYPNAGVRFGIARKTLVAIKTTTLETLLLILYTHNIPFDYNKQDAVLKIFGNTIKMIGTSDDDKLRGFECDVLYVNEALELSKEDWFQLKIRATSKIIVDYNPSAIKHFLYDELDNDESTVRLVTTYRDNPHLPKLQVEEIENLAKIDPVYARVYAAGLRGQVMGLIFENIELVDWDDIEIKSPRIGLDFGFANDPAAIIEVGFWDRRIAVRQIAYSKQLHYEDIAKIIKATGLRHTVIADSADPRGIDFLAKQGIRIKPCKKGAGSVEAGIRLMSQYAPILVGRGSVDIQNEFKTYRTNDKGEVIDEDNHAIDAIRYCVMDICAGSIRISTSIHR